MNTALANAMFGWVLCGIQSIVYLVFVVRYLYMKNRVSSQVLKEFVEKNVLYSAIATLTISSVGWATWFYWVQVLWTDIKTGDCLEGYNLFDFFNFLILLFSTVWSAITVAVVCLCCVCCFPCIVGTIRAQFAEARNAEDQRNGVLNAIVNRKFNPEDFKENTECAICMCEF